MRYPGRTLVSTAVVMMLSAGCANRTNASGNTPRAAAKMTQKDYEAIMKKVGPAYASLQKELDRGELAKSETEAKQLVELFGEAEKFWAQYNRPDAVRWAHQAQTSATQIASGIHAAQALNRLEPRVQRPVQRRLQRAQTAATNMGAVCKQCHGKYREGSEATGFRIKPGVLAR
jgi:cytochrome c556